MNELISPECISLSDNAYQDYMHNVQRVINDFSHQAWSRDDMELCRETFSVCPHTRDLTIRVFNAKDKPILEHVVTIDDYQIKPPLKNCVECGLYQSIEAMNARLGNKLPHCPKGCHECHVRFERLRQDLNKQSRQFKKVKPKYYRRVS